MTDRPAQSAAPAEARTISTKGLCDAVQFLYDEGLTLYPEGFRKDGLMISPDLESSVILILERYAALRTAQLQQERDNFKVALEAAHAWTCNCAELREEIQGLESEGDDILKAFNKVSADELAQLREHVSELLEELWDVKNGLMGIRDSESLTPTKEEWIAGKRALLTSSATPPPPEGE